MEFEISQVIGNSLEAKNDVKAYNRPNGTLVGIFKKGGIVGTVYSYVINNGKIYWMVDGNIGGYETFFIEHEEQNLILVEGKKEQTLFQKVTDFLTPNIGGEGIGNIFSDNANNFLKLVKWLIIIILSLLAYKFIIKKYIL